MSDIFVRDRYLREVDVIVLESRLGRPPKVENDFNDVFEIRKPDERLPDRQWEDVEELSEFPTRGNCFGFNRQY
jgi:hypothetical protein